jgi:hypothetical protein
LKGPLSERLKYLVLVLAVKFDVKEYVLRIRDKMKITVKKSGKYRIYPQKSQISNLENQFPHVSLLLHRTHRCVCGFVVNRALNAALNILRIGMDTLKTTV